MTESLLQRIPPQPLKVTGKRNITVCTKKRSKKYTHVLCILVSIRKPLVLNVLLFNKPEMGREEFFCFCNVPFVMCAFFRLSSNLSHRLQEIGTSSMHSCEAHAQLCEKTSRKLSRLKPTESEVFVRGAPVPYICLPDEYMPITKYAECLKNIRSDMLQK